MRKILYGCFGIITLAGAIFFNTNRTNFRPTPDYGFSNPLTRSPIPTYTPLSTSTPTATVDQAAANGPRSQGDVVFRRTKPVLKCVINGYGEYHKKKPAVAYVQLSREYDESFYVGGQRAVMSGRHISQLVGEGSVPVSMIDDLRALKNYFLNENRVQPTPSTKSEEE